MQLSRSALTGNEGKPTGIMATAPSCCEMPGGSLAPTDFKKGCEEFRRLCEGLLHDFTAVLSHSDDEVFLRIRKVVGLKAKQWDPEAMDELEEWLDEEDSDQEIAQIYNEKAELISVEYKIVYSPVYGVPVLYFYFSSLPPDGPHGLEAVYEYLVPRSTIAHLQTVGVMGGVSATNHPITDMPCFFVHPCNTADAMRELQGARVVSGLQYLMLWIGLIGASVGLNLPKELAIESENQKEV